MTRVAAIDCGTNSIRLLVAEADAAGRLTDIDRQMRVVRLGQDVDARGAFVPEALLRTRTALEEYAQIIRDNGATAIRMVATSATRDAENRDEFFYMTQEVLGDIVAGAKAEVITGDEEARLSFAGAVGDLSTDTDPVLVVDLGGGSTELVLGSGGVVAAAKSSNIGCVRVTERCLPSDPPTADEIDAAERFIAERLAVALETVPVEQTRSWVGVAGTMTTIAAIALGLDEYQADRIHLSRIPFDQLNEVCDRLIGMSRKDRAALGPMHPGRVDVIGGGALITRTLARILSERAGVDELVVSEHDILDGIAASIVRR
ncbi:Ppx/GppA phosphatase family protein [Tomitella biformata]|uniref:Ppx/GppA phosphatase family protein n=1 Tax=Tomitella biformata TaxID=630403 RepID=UPI000462EB3E|nr:Ppx/GppA phosphatase family protein [Tomitella biformata]